jgi:hypothetical protein
MKRRVLRWVLAIAVVLLLAAGFAWRMATSVDVIETVPLSTGQYNVRFLKADIGTLSYSSDDKLRAFLRPRVPGNLVKKLGDVTTISKYTAWRSGPGEPPLVLLFQLLTPQNALQNTTSTVFGKIEFPESTGFVFQDDINGYSSHGQGTSLHQFEAFPRRDPMLRFRLYETNGKLLMEKSIPNPGYRTGIQGWTPESLPQPQRDRDVTATLSALSVDQKARFIRPQLEFESSDESWLKPTWTHRWSDATGNVGQWLSPFEPAWKLHLTVRRRRNAQFPPEAIWKLNPQSISDGQTLTTVEKAQVVDGLGVRVRYVAPPGRISDEGGTITITPPRNPGHPGLGISAGSTTVNGKLVSQSTIESGTPFIRVDHDPLPPGVELVCDVRDEHGVLINEKLVPGHGGVNNVQFYAVYFLPGPDSKTVQLEVRVSQPRDFEFFVEPPTELREAIKASPASRE